MLGTAALLRKGGCSLICVRKNDQLQGLWWGAEHSGMPLGELAERVQQWIRGLDKINVDAFLDSIPVLQEGDRPSLPKRE